MILLANESEEKLRMMTDSTYQLTNLKLTQNFLKTQSIKTLNLKNLSPLSKHKIDNYHKLLIETSIFNSCLNNKSIQIKSFQF